MGQKEGRAMKKLSREAWERARQFILTQARPLERALLAYHFAGGPAEAVLLALASFQNEDGGFGHALEPDVRTPSSSALATGIGLTALKELGCGADNPLVRRAVEYLLATFDPQQQVWRVVPPETNDFPHAPWWHDQDGSLVRTFDGFLIIPRAELLALLHRFSTHVPAAWLEDVTEQTVRYVEEVGALGTGGGSDLAYVLDLAQAEGLPERFRQRLLARVRQVVPSVVERDPAQWGTYCLTPLTVAPSPESPVADLLWEDLQTNLDDTIERQSPEGSWDPVWSWAGLYPQDWELARREWRGEITLRTLSMLQAFGRIEEV
jgi:hypothetical protein